MFQSNKTSRAKHQAHEKNLAGCSEGFLDAESQKLVVHDNRS